MVLHRGTTCQISSELESLKQLNWNPLGLWWVLFPSSGLCPHFVWFVPERDIRGLCLISPTIPTKRTHSSGGLFCRRLSRRHAQVPPTESHWSFRSPESARRAWKLKIASGTRIASERATEWTRWNRLGDVFSKFPQFCCRINGTVHSKTALFFWGGPVFVQSCQTQVFLFTKNHLPP